MQIECDGISQAGRRANNEDALFVDTALGLYAVADGMGGYEGGEVASNLAIGTISEFLKNNGACTEETWPFALDRSRTFVENMVDAAVQAAHRRVVAKRVGRLSRMGSTLSALLFRDGHVVIGHVGDSRVYRLRAGELTQLTRDHSLYNELADATPVDAIGPKNDFPYRNIITQALGMDGHPSAEVLRAEVEPGDVYLLCTDGLSEVLPEYHMKTVLSALSPDEACRELVEEAYEWGSHDNITAVVVKVLPEVSVQ